MLKRATCGYSRHIIIALGMAAVLLLPVRTAFAQGKPVVPTGTKSAAKQTCLVKYSTLSALMCDSTSPDDVLAPLAKVNESTSEANQAGKPSPTPTKKERPPIRELEGIKEDYLYTDRVTEDKTGWYTKLREKPNVDSKRKEIIRTGDKIRVMKEEKKDWYYVQIFKSHDKKLEGKEGYIEKWLVDNENVPEEPTPTPTKPPEKGDESKDGGQGNEAVVAGAVTSGDGEALFNMINDFRASNGLPKFEKSARLCEIARVRAPEIAGEVATGSIHSGFTARGYGYPTAVENAAGYGNIQANFNWWLNSGLHRASILGEGLKYSCCECSGGNCVQIFSPNP